LTIITQNINRLNHQLALYKMSVGELLQKLNEDRKTQLVDSDVFQSEIKLSLLKKIDQIFKKGLAYYIDPKDPVRSSDESIFFRKDRFNSSLNLGARQIVNQFEEEKLAFSTLAKLSDFKLKRSLPVCKVTDSPESTAAHIRQSFNIVTVSNDRDYLKNLITAFADHNILVFEFVETHNKRERANINGFYLAPDVIVLKRQKSFKREIFTLVHELGHYLLNEEEIDDNLHAETQGGSLNKVEKWCNDFAYYFLIRSFKQTIKDLVIADASNDYHHELIEKISAATHLSQLALYTQLLLTNKISPGSYGQISSYQQKIMLEREQADKDRFEQEKQKAMEEGRKPMASAPKPIISPLYQHTLQTALFTGLINEAEFCRKMHISADKLERYAQ